AEPGPPGTIARWPRPPGWPPASTATTRPASAIATMSSAAWARTARSTSTPWPPSCSCCRSPARTISRPAASACSISTATASSRATATWPGRKPRSRSPARSPHDPTDGGVMALYAFDGTDDNDSDVAIDAESVAKDTNIFRFYSAYQANLPQPKTRYVPGVGTRFGVVGLALGGAFGLGWAP